MSNEWAKILNISDDEERVIKATEYVSYLEDKILDLEMDMAAAEEGGQEMLINSLMKNEYLSRWLNRHDYEVIVKCDLEKAMY